MWTVAFGAVAVPVRGRRSGTVEGQYERVRLGGLSICGSHICPVCGPRVAAKRKEEVEAAVLWGLSQGLVPVMLTLTTSHTLQDRLDSLVLRQRAALRRLKRHRLWRQSKGQIPHIISAFEETYGKSGWHPHIHLLLFIACDSPAKALRLVGSLRKAWTVSAAAEDLKVGRAGFKATVNEDVPATVAKAAGAYICKGWGISGEMTLTHYKKAKGDSLKPSDLLGDAYGGDSRALALWQVWARAVKGKSVLRFSQGLKAAAGIGEVSDVEAATVPPEDVEVLIDSIDAGLWEHAKASGLDRDRLVKAATGGRTVLRQYLHALGCHTRTVSNRSAPI